MVLFPVNRSVSVVQHQIAKEYSDFSKSHLSTEHRDPVAEKEPCFKLQGKNQLQYLNQN